MSSGFSLDEDEGNYFDLDDILAEQQKMQISFNVDIPGLGFLENNPGGPLHKNEKVLMPYWIIMCLTLIPLSDDGNIFELNYPKCFNKQCLNQLIADPTTVNLYQLCPYYYQLGYNLLNVAQDSFSLSEILYNAFRKRIPLIMNYSQQVHISKEKAEFLRGLDESERQLYKIGCESVLSMKKWINREYGTLKIAKSLNKSRLIL
ncbi:GINS complex, Psf3 component [Anaeromyces robustus]|uniref:DNA replication complex GINS protein PSF3 n=1 Tax=Anaeromyces robustus TaxID=1754192 RepID=A0A1Y1XPM1_9FUNG|nr:GINS complex, Psf3 component [Anaeromyces robustus]|eukprot:ORX87693.1 GINS complex, Psf3 component [Anaeromyces robustus]